MTASAPPFSSLENEFLRLDYLTTIGPCIIGLYVQGTKANLLAETPGVHWPTPHGEYVLYGGHRLWVAPEDPFYTVPEGGIRITGDKNKVVLAGCVDAAGLEKEITVRLDENRVHLAHRITWHGSQSIECAAWGITQLRRAGMAVLPLGSSEGLAPDRNVVFWPYSQFRDPRFELHDDMILLHGQAAEPAFKVGCFNKYGWIACTVENTLFVKRFPVLTASNYPDRGCNVEAYVKDSYLELETLGPLERLDPNQSLIHEETWEVITDTLYPATIEAARAISARLASNQETTWSIE
ncbi:MAG: DUF4380 domain-containing protein [Chloroflexi bacterium]|nr:DUF4380 domain-containing protein [Chloroflexota bacterium]